MDAAHIMLFTILLQANFVVSSEDRAYCQNIKRYSFSYRTPGINMMPIKTSESKWNMVVQTPTESKLYLLNDVGSLQGGKEVALPDSAFCLPASGTFHFADVNGDGAQDFVCQSSTDGALTALHYSTASFSNERPIASGYTCDPNSNQMLTGDFDGNGSDDFLCVDDTKATYTIYFNRRCTYDQHHSNRNSAFNPFKERTRSHVAHDHHEHSQHGHTCDGSLPKTLVLTGTLPCSTVGDAIVVADVNGDKKEDLVCHSSSDNTVSFILSSGSTSSDIFSAPPSSTTAGATCLASSVLLPADVDGDGDDDLVCMVLDATRPANRNPPISYSIGADYLPFAQSPSTYCLVFCDSTASHPTEFFAADINGDGYDDIVCQITFARVVRRDVNFSQAIP